MAEQAILTAAPESEEAALADLRRVLSSGKHGAHGRAPSRLAPGLFLTPLPGSFSEFAAALRAHPPVFIRHVQPVQQEVPLHGEPDDLEALRSAAVTLAPALDPGVSFSVQTRILTGEAATDSETEAGSPYRRFEINERLASALVEATGAPLDVREPEQVLSVLLTPRQGYLGLSRARDNLSAWAGGQVRFAREPDQVSRSEFKLLEALQVFDLVLPPTGHALDLGASPGGWTRLLRRAGLEVTAVDPGELDPRVAGDPGVRHVRALAQEFRCRKGEFAVIVNDIRMDARDSARLMHGFAPCLAPDGRAVMTLKLPHLGAEQVAHQAIHLLLQRYSMIGARQLYHNRSEISVALRRKEAAPASHVPGLPEAP